MKLKYILPFEDAPPWLKEIEIERDGDDILFTAVKRSDNLLGTFRVTTAKLERMIERLKED